MKVSVSFIPVWRIGLGALLALTLISGAQAAVAENSIQEQARQARVSIEALAGNPISPEQAQVLWQKIEKTLSESRAFKGSDGPTESEDTNILEILMVRLHRVFNSLIQQKRIHLLTPEGREKLNIEKSFCATKEFCRMPRAFYLPLPGLIFLNGSLDEAQLVESFFHELMHAYQFSYRLPLDLILANRLAEEGKLSASSIYDFLSYFYETQANWQTLRFNPENPWKKHYAISLPVSGFASQLVKAGLFLLAPVPYMLVDVASRDKAEEGNKPTLPEVDHRHFYSSLTGDSTGVGYQGARGAIGLHELCLQNKKTLPVFSKWDAKFHRAYAKAVERTYFGKLDFIFRDGVPDNEVFNVLHNYYYSYLGEMQVESEQEAPTKWKPYAKACDRLFARSVESPTSPLAFWLSLPREEFQACPTYNIVTKELRRLGFDNLSVETPVGSDDQIPVLTDRNMNLDVARPRVDSANVKNLEIRNQDSKSQAKGEGLRLYSRSLLEIRDEQSSGERHRSPFLIFEKGKSSRSEDPNSQFKSTGGEGTTPDIPVLPAFPILPQLEVSPD